MQTKKLFIGLSFLLIYTLGYAQKNEHETVNIPEPFHIQVKSFKKGNLAFEIDTRKKTVNLSEIEKSRNLRGNMGLTWNKQTKDNLFKYIDNNKLISELEKFSAPRPSNIDKSKSILYINFLLGSRNLTFWINPPKIKGKEKNYEEVINFLKELRKIIDKEPVNNRNRIKNNLTKEKKDTIS
jgi:hypothetical protein